MPQVADILVLCAAFRLESIHRRIGKGVRSLVEEQLESVEARVERVTARECDVRREGCKGVTERYDVVADVHPYRRRGPLLVQILGHRCGKSRPQVLQALRL